MNAKGRRTCTERSRKRCCLPRNFPIQELLVVPVPEKVMESLRLVEFSTLCKTDD